MDYLARESSPFEESFWQNIDKEEDFYLFTALLVQVL